MQRNAEYIGCLDGWRAIAISLVIVSHGLWDASRMAQKLGALGVHLFFAISGYLICTLLLREQERTGTINLASFYTRRAFRILPPAVLYLSVVALCAGAGWLAVEPFELPTALFAANFFPDRAHYTQHFWSLSVEEHFYLVWPALLLFMGPRRACKIGLVLTALCVILRPWEAQVVEGAFRYQRSEMRLDSFVLPCYLAVLLREEKWRERGARWLTGSAMIAMLVLIVALSLVAERWTGFNTWNKFAQAALMPLLVVAPILRPQMWLNRVLNHPKLAFVGSISYSLYLWQQFFVHDTSATLARLALLPLAILAAGLCAWASTEFLERPFRELGHDLSKQLSRRSVGAL